MDPSRTEALETLREIAKRLERDKTFNPVRAKFQVHSFGEDRQGNPSVSVDVGCEYSCAIQFLMVPLYAMFSLIGQADLVDWCDDVAYFRRAWGIEAKKRELQKIREELPKRLLVELEKLLQKRGENE